METTEKAVLQRFYDIINAGRPEDLDEVCSPDLVGHAGAGANLGELKANISGFIAPFPDLEAKPRYLVQEGDLVSSWVSYTGTHSADFAGIPGTGRQVRFAAWDLARVQEGKIVELTQYCDVFTIMAQIGAMPTAAPA